MLKSTYLTLAFRHDLLWIHPCDGCKEFMNILIHQLVIDSTFGLPGNERADQKAKQGAKLSQQEVSLTLRRAKSIISTFIDKYTTVKQKNQEPWKIPATVDPISRHLERAKAVACFRLTTGHDFLEYISTGLARMDGDHQLQSTGLDKYVTDNIISRYWEAQCQMVKKQSTLT
ncbi:reverse transcriptase [Trichonephila clavipes]|nr:reverse transcriptase [Trichonephila clavipes]